MTYKLIIGDRLFLSISQALGYYGIYHQEFEKRCNAGMTVIKALKTPSEGLPKSYNRRQFLTPNKTYGKKLETEHDFRVALMEAVLVKPTMLGKDLMEALKCKDLVEVKKKLSRYDSEKFHYIRMTTPL